ncbi:MAG: hypothetical protein DRN20_04865 [Thermoplasmata archaeon]|mgnify:CR=1 FL=1|nr:MAG: hypothetical protein DRN20_04865 [Thermoplasmata archaeon]
MIKIPYVSWRGRYCPLVEVQIINQDKIVRTLAYLDTGATYSVFHADFAEELGLDIYSGERKDITVGDGGMIPLYLFELKLIIEQIHIDALIGFSDRLGTGINIIGREGVLDDYMVCFDGKNREVIWHV